MSIDKDKIDQAVSEPVYAIVRFDRFAQSPEDSFTVKEIVRSQTIAESEVN